MGKYSRPRLQPDEDGRGLLQVPKQIGPEVAIAALLASVRRRKFNQQKLLRFAQICRVEKIIRACLPLADAVAGTQSRSDRALSDATWSREKLHADVWSQPLKALARIYGISDVALAKRCKKLGIPLPGRGYWAKMARV